MANGDGNKTPKIIEKKIVGAIFQEPTENEKGAFNLIEEDKVMVKELGGVADLSYPTSETRRGRVENNGQICPTLTASENGICRIETRYRIRKLTPLECWRLMNFKDEDYKKAEEVNSQTQLYKEAGNSIVKVVLMAIMSQLNIKDVTPWNELSVEERSNLSGKIKETTTNSTNEENGI